MESNHILSDLDADRATLAQQARSPWWLATGFGFIAASFVVSPAFDQTQPGVIIASGVLSAVLIAEHRKSTGIDVGSPGPGSWLLVVAAVLIVLGLFSTALALASLELHRWIAVPTVAAFAVGAAATRLFAAFAREHIRRVR